jgi:predicted amidohydrolase YtcJ
MHPADENPWREEPTIAFRSGRASPPAFRWRAVQTARPGEGITRDQAVMAYTRSSAFAEFAEQE